MKDLLFFITSYYPNNVGDTAFIENEIKYLSKAYKKIVILSTNPKHGESVPMPENCRAYFLRSMKSEVLSAILLPLSALKHFSILKKEFAELKAKKSGIKIYLLSLIYYLKSVAIYKKLKKLIKAEGKPDLLYTFWYSNATLSCMMLGDNYKFCSRVHGYDLYEEVARGHYQPFKHITDRKISSVFFISRKGMEYYKSHFMTGSLSKYHLAYLGSPKGSVQVNNSTNFELLSISNAVPVKRIEMIIEALSLLPSEIRVNWTHIGGGVELEKLKLIAEDSLSDKENINHRFLGAMPHSDVIKYLSSNHVSCFINTSISEGLPVTMMEAFSFAIPIIAPDVGGIEEIVDDSVNGFLLPQNLTAQTVATAILNMYKLSDDSFTSMRRAALEKWERAFDSDKNYAALASMLLEL